MHKYIHQIRRYGEGGGWGVHVWECMYTRGGFMSMYGKTNTVLQIKIKGKNNNKNNFKNKIH